MEELANVTAALAVAHLIHAFAETINVRSKLQRLIDAKNNRETKPYPVNINTRSKAYAAGLIAFLLPAAIAYGAIAALSPSIETLLWISLIAIVIVELYNLVALDKYHVAIQPLIDEFDKNSSS